MDRRRIERSRCVRNATDKLCGNRRRYPDVYLASTFSSINNSVASTLLSFPSLSIFLFLHPTLSRFVFSVPPSLQRIELAHASASLIKRVSIIHAFAKLPLPLQWLPIPLARVCDRSIKPSSRHPSYIYCFSKNN